MASGIPLTVLMACYNAERYLADSIASVLAQSFRDFEFVIVDDGSKDRTAQILEHFARRDGRIVLLRKEHTGLADSLNFGIERARGKWIARIDADDLCNQQRLERQLAYVRTHQDVVFLGTGCVEIDEKGTVRKVHRYPSDHRRLVRRLQRRLSFPPHSSALFRTDAAKRVGGYRTQVRRAQDLDLWLRLSEIGTLNCLPDPLIQLRKHGTQVSLERDGIQQLVDGYAAITSYFIRLARAEDPLDGVPGSAARYLEWIESRLKEEGVIARHKIWTGARALALGASNRFTGLLRALVRLGKSRWGLTLVGQRLLGTGLPKRLAEEWIKCCGER